MPHVHELIDFTVVAYIVHQDKVLLADRLKLKTWMPVGGHIELDEDPEEALLREIKEECGLVATVLGNRPDIVESGVKPLLSPVYMDIHDIDEGHKHVGMVYFATAATNEVALAPTEHAQLRWFSREDLSDPSFGVRPYIRFYAEQALSHVAKIQ